MLLLGWLLLAALPNAEQHPCRWDSKGALYIHALFLSRFPRGPRSCGGTVPPGPSEAQPGHALRACRVGVSADPPPPTHSPHLPLGCHWAGPKGCEQKRLEDLPAKTKHSGISFSPLRHRKTHLGWRVLRHPEAISEGRGAGAARDGHPA